MIKKIKASKSEKILLFFLVSLAIFSFSFFFLIKNKCLFIDSINLEKENFEKRENIVLMEVECGLVVIELYPKISPQAVERFKFLVNKGLYDNSAFYKVIEDTLVQAGDLEYGNINNIDYFKVGSGSSGLGNLKSEIDENFNFTEGSVAMARGDNFNSEDSEFFITLKDIPIYKGEYTPLGKVILGLDSLKKIKTGNKSNYVLRPDFIKSLKFID
tara:strand:+ start:433 stop:1077 length:645 start_codon:yes stop_codon:yes gene_type:complete